MTKLYNLLIRTMSLGLKFGKLDNLDSVLSESVTLGYINRITHRYDSESCSIRLKDAFSDIMVFVLIIDFPHRYVYRNTTIKVNETTVKNVIKPNKSECRGETSSMIDNDYELELKIDRIDLIDKHNHSKASIILGPRITSSSRIAPSSGIVVPLPQNIVNTLIVDNDPRYYTCRYNRYVDYLDPPFTVLSYIYKTVDAYNLVKISIEKTYTRSPGRRMYMSVYKSKNLSDVVSLGINGFYLDDKVREDVFASWESLGYVDIDPSSINRFIENKIVPKLLKQCHIYERISEDLRGEFI